MMGTARLIAICVAAYAYIAAGETLSSVTDGNFAAKCPGHPGPAFPGVHTFQVATWPLGLLPAAIGAALPAEQLVCDRFGPARAP